MIEHGNAEHTDCYYSCVWRQSTCRVLDALTRASGLCCWHALGSPLDLAHALITLQEKESKVVRISVAV